MVQPTQIRISAEQYYQLPQYDSHDLIQLIDGEVVIGMHPIPKHQRIVRRLIVLIDSICTRRGGEVFSSPIEVYLDEHNIFEPDVLYLAPDSNCTVTNKRLEGAPELVVEILSPSTAKYDRQQKYAAYERHGVHEYWIVDPAYEMIEVYLDREGRFDRQDIYTVEDTFESVVLGETVSVKAIFE